MKDRIKRLRLDAGMTQEEFGQAIGATRGMVTTYEKGTIPTQSTRMLICHRFNVNPEWLETGEGKPYKEGLIPSLVQALRAMPEVQSALEELMPRMTLDDWRALNDALARFIRACKPPDE